MADSALRSFTISTQLVRVGAKLGKKYLNEAKGEASRDLHRLISAGLMLTAGGLFLVHALIFTHAAVVAALYAAGVSVLYIAIGVLGFDVLLGSLLLFLGARMLRKPMLPQTRAKLRELQAMVEKG